MKEIGNSIRCKGRASFTTNLTASLMMDNGTTTNSQAGEHSITSFLNRLLNLLTIVTSTKSRNTGSNTRVSNP
jgi:hypothetical protein